MAGCGKFSFFLIALMASASSAAAQTDAVCDDLRGRLANLPEVIGTNPQARQYSSAITEQSFEIRRLQNDMRDRYCDSDSMVILGAEDAAACDRMEMSLARMQENLRYLTERRNGGDSGGSDDILRGQLQDALRQNGCEQPVSADPQSIIDSRQEPPTPEQQARRTDTFIPPGGLEMPPPGTGGPIPRQGYSSGGAYGSNIQTVCVRTCDGGFFPMTAASALPDFRRDAETCARMCPGVPTELFFHYLPNQETTDMISASTGAPYSAMPYAFAYRKRPPGEKSSCTCNLSAYYEDMRREKAMAEPQSGRYQGSITTIETKKPAAVVPPPATPIPPPAQVPDRPYDPSARTVRQVGPQFLAPDQGKIDLKHPAMPGPQPEQ